MQECANIVEEYDDDTAIIPRSSLVIARRLPAARAGHGRAARYVSGRMPVHAKQQHKAQAPTDAQAALNNAKTEQDKIAAMFAVEDEQWQNKKNEMALARAVPFKGQKKPNMPDRPLPKGYICHRCNKEGHWIYDCPTNDDPTFVPKPKLKKTTGIPRSFLERVEKTDIDDDESGEAKGYMIDADGNRVRVKTDTASWEKEQARQKAAAASKQAAEQENIELLQLGLECPIDHRLFEVPTKTPCCSKTYCYQCIEDALIENDLVCPNCGKEVLIDALLPDNDMALKIKAYRDDKSAAETKAKEAIQEAEAAAAAEILAKQAEAEEKAKKEKAAAKEAKEAKKKADESVVESTEPKEEQGQSATDADGTLKPHGTTKIKRSNSKTSSPSPAPSATSQKSKGRASSTESSAKKRPAEDELKNNRIPTAPAAMRKQQEQQKPQDYTPQFLEDMEKLSKGNFPAFMNQNPMASMAMGMNMPNAMAGPPAGPAAMMGNNNMMNAMMQNAPWMAQMSMMNNMNNNFANGAGFNNNQGFQGQNWHNNNQQNQQQQQQWNNNTNHRGGFNNFNNRGRGNFNPNFNQQNPNEEDSAYFRQPVNPQRHQRARRMRPSEFTELGRR